MRTLLAILILSFTCHAGTSNLSGITLGADFNGINHLDGDASFLLVIPSALTTTQRQTLETLLGNKYGITITHP